MELRRREEDRAEWTADCDFCGRIVARYRGDDDVQCEACGTWYNAFGQRLRDDWRSNPSNYDDEIGDLEGYEIAALRNERYDD